MKNLSRLKKLDASAGDAMKAFWAFDKAVFAEGTLTVQQKQLMAVAVALTTQCPYCIEIHTKAAREAGASDAQLAETAVVAAAIRAGGAVTWATVTVEVVGGLMILFGALIPLATIPMVVVLFVAIVTVHLPNGFSSIKLQSFDAAGAHFGQPGYETDLLYLASLIALCFGGAGPFSIDRLLDRVWSRPIHLAAQREAHVSDTP